MRFVLPEMGIGRALQYGFLALVWGGMGCATQRAEVEAAAGEQLSTGGIATRGNPAVAEAPTIPEGPWTLREVLDRVESSNLDIQVARERVAGASAQIGVARSAFLPSAQVDFSILRADAPSTYLFKTIDARALPPGLDFNDPGTFNNAESGVNASWNLYNGGRDLLALKMAEVDRELSQLDEAALRNRLVAAAVDGWFGKRLAAEQTKVARDSVKSVSAALRETKARFEVGSALRADVLSLEVRLAEARESALRGEAAERIANAGLAYLMGLDPSRPLELGEEDWAVEDLPGTKEAAIAEALMNRPELAAARRRLEQAGMGASMARRAWAPRADAMARAFWDDSDARFDIDRNNWILGLTVSWDLYAGGRRQSELKAAQALLREFEAADQGATLGIQRELETAWARMDEARARVATSRVSERQATESLELVRARYAAGAETVTRYLEAESMLTRARQRRVAADIDLKRSRVDAARALGRFASFDIGP